ncbi:DeoR/GlpR family DNA-binding transcription regulator [Terrabacter sp. 2YAF2]|uniref:DeoR/GlpR family DNA-binding transcription regulator n=1 Tax=Terrabacter sp. 2YAF2 TaxID=3233026 RepID=UPI003F95063B
MRETVGDALSEVSALRYDTAPERRQSILDAVEGAGFVSVTELTRTLGVSDMTVRRDLRKLAHDGRVRIVHGGVSALRPALHSPEFTGRAEEHAEGKQAIGETAVAALDSRATVAIDAGTTTYAAMQALPADFLGTVVTHSVPVMQLALTRGLGRVVGLGGELLPSSQAFVGPRTVEATKGLRVDTLLLGAAAVGKHGIYVSTDNERPTKLALMGIAERIVLLVDASKFTTSAPVLLCGWDAITGVISDAAPPPEMAKRLGKLPEGIRVVG